VTPSLSSAWPHISLISIVDILLVAVLIYQLLSSSAEPRRPMLVGLRYWHWLLLCSAWRTGTLNWLLSTLLP